MRPEGPVASSHPVRRVAIFGAVIRPLQAFLRTQAASGILLLLAAAAALIWVNLHGSSYHAVFELPLSLGAGGRAVGFSLHAVINDGLMSLFFFVVGMEIKRELVVGHLNSRAKAFLPAIAALGGMVVPAAIYLAFNWSGEGRAGWGIPMATDIAFTIGVLSLLSERVPRSLVVFVTALAIFDDLGGILVIALFYGSGLALTWLLGAAALALVLYGMNRWYVTNGLLYLAVGGPLWFALHHGGIHPTVAGVVLGMMIPARPQRSPRDVIRELAEHAASLDQKPPDVELQAAEILAIEERLEDIESPLNRFTHMLHTFSAFFIMPVFALANAGVSLDGVGLSTLAGPIALGAGVGLVAGKAIGIFGFTLVALQLRIAPMPEQATHAKLLGVSVIAGIGFTVAIFIAALAFRDAPAQLDEAKIGILLGSLLAGVLGFAILRLAKATPGASR